METLFCLEFYSMIASFYIKKGHNSVKNEISQ